MTRTASRASRPEAEAAAQGTEDSSAARTFLSHFAHGFLLTRRQLDASIVEARTHGYRYSRVLCRVVRRTVELVVSPAPPWTGLLAELPDPNSFDLWAHDEATLHAQTACVAACPECNPAQSRADANGQRVCPLCHGRRVVSAQLVLRVKERLMVTAHPQTAADAHPRLLEPGDFNAGSYPYDIEDDQEGPELAQHLPRELQPSLDSSERVTWAHLQVFDARSTELRCSNLFGEDRPIIMGGTQRFAARPVWFAFRTRARFLLALAAGFAVVALAIPGFYANQSEFHALYGHARVVGLGTCLGACAVVAVAAQLTLHRRARSRSWLRAGVFAFAFAALATTTIATTSSPSLKTLNAALDAGDTRRADIEGETLARNEMITPELGTGLDHWKLKRISQSNDNSVRVGWLRRHWYSSLEGDARDQVVSRLRDEARTAYEKDDRPARRQLREAGLNIDRGLDEVFDGLDALSRLKDCIQNDDFPCALYAMNDAEKVKTLSREITSAVAVYLAFLRATIDKKMGVVSDPRAATTTALSALKNAIEVGEELVKRAGGSSPSLADMRALEKKLNAKDGRERDAATKAETARLAASAHSSTHVDGDDDDDASLVVRPGYRPLVCCDGTVSTRCMCGDNKILCCSLHGGKCGCL